MYQSQLLDMSPPPNGELTVPIENEINALLRNGPRPAHWLGLDPDTARYLRMSPTTLQWRDCAKVPRQVCATSGTTPPLPGTSDAGAPCIDWVGTSGVALRAPTVEHMRVGTEAFTAMFVGEPTHTAGNVVCGYVLGAPATASDYPLIFGFTGSGAQQAFRLWNGNLSVSRISSVRNVKDETHLFTVTGDKVIGLHFYVDNALDTANGADLNGLTDGRFQIGAGGSGVSSINARGKFQDFLFWNENLSIPKWSSIRQAWSDLLRERSNLT